MNKKLIPDVAYEVDGDTVTIEQGQVEPSCVVLHKIHIAHLVNEMGATVGDLNASPQLIRHRESINEMATDLYKMLSGISHFPPTSEESEDVLLAAELVQKTGVALAMWGDH